MTNLRAFLDRLSLKVEKEFNKDTRIVVFGTGNTTNLYQKAFELEKLIPMYYADNDKRKWNKLYKGKKIINPNDLKEISNIVVLICSANRHYNLQIKNQLEEMRIPNFFIDEYILTRHIEDIMDNYNLKSRDFLTYGILKS